MAVLPAMSMRQYSARRIVWWSTSRLHSKPLDATIGQGLRRTAPATAMVIDGKKKNTNKTKFLAAVFTVDRIQKLWKFRTPKCTPSTHHHATSCMKSSNATIEVEKLSFIWSHQTSSVGKSLHSYNLPTKLVKNGRIFAAIVVKLLITFPIFVRWQRLIAWNVAELSSVHRGVPY